MICLGIIGTKRKSLLVMRLSLIETPFSVEKRCQVVVRFG
jgi:hypothetical protein